MLNCQIVYRLTADPLRCLIKHYAASILVFFFWRAIMIYVSYISKRMIRRDVYICFSSWLFYINSARIYHANYQYYFKTTYVII